MRTRRCRRREASAGRSRRPRVSDARRLRDDRFGRAWVERIAHREASRGGFAATISPAQNNLAKEILRAVSFQAVSDNLRESFRVIAASRAPGEIRELRGVSIASAGVAFQMFNAAFLSAPVATENDLSQRILLAATHFHERGLQ